MQSLTSTYHLSNGVTIPIVGFGTWQMEDGPTTVHAVHTAIETGYRHIDTAAAYQNEGSVGKAIRESGLARSDVFLTTKLQNRDHGYQATHDAFKRSLQALGVSYLDLYLIHWQNPIAFRDRWQTVNAETWRAFEELYEAGLVRSIGVSNFRPHHLETLSQSARIIPMVNQIRLCPGDVDLKTVDYSRAQNIQLEAYSPLGTGLVFDVPDLQSVAQKKNRTIAQIALRWSLQKGFLPLPKSTTPARIVENAYVFDFELTQEEINQIDNLTDCCDQALDPDKTNF